MTPSPTPPHRTWLAALLADALSLSLVLAGRSLWLDAFRQPTEGVVRAEQALLLGGAYLLFLTGLGLLRQQGPTASAGAAWPPQGRRLTMLALPLSLFLIAALGDLSGYFQAAATVDLTNPGGSYFLVTTPALYVALGLLYLLVLSWRTTPTPPPAGQWDGMLAGLGWLALNLFVIPSAVYLSSLIQGWGATGTLSALLLVSALALLFSLPRALYLTWPESRPAWASWVLFLVSLAQLLTNAGGA